MSLIHPPTGYLPDELYTRILESTPILCVDLVIRRKGRYLLVKRSNPPMKGEWWVPGGRVFRGEKARDAVVRKAREELGLSVGNLELMGYYEEFYRDSALGVPYHALSLVFTAEPENEDVVLSDESSEWGWFDALPGKFQVGRHVV